MITHQIDLNLIPTGVLPRINVSQYDYGESVECTLWNGDVLYTIPTGTTAKVSGTKKDNTGFEYNCTIANNKVTFAIQQQMTAFAGEVATELTLYKSGNRLSTINFILNVEEAALQDDVVISETDIPIIQEIPELVAECEDYADKAHKWATYGSDSEQPSATNNAKYWAQQSQQSFQKTDVYKVMGYNGAKNLNATPYSTLSNPSTENGITWTRNADGSVTANGTATANTFYYCHYRLGSSNNLVLKNGTYILSGCPSGGGDGKYWVYSDCTKNGSSRILGVDYGNGVSITLNGDDNDANSVKLSVVLTVRSGYTANNLTFYPMVRHAEDTDTTYHPYAMTNKDLTPLVQNVAVRTSYTATSGQTLESALASWCDANKGDIGKHHLIADISAGGVSYTVYIGTLNTNGYTVGIVAVNNSTNDVYVGKRVCGSNAVLTELAPKTVSSDSYSIATYGGIICADKFGKVVTITGTGIGSTQSFSSTSGQLIYTLPTIYQPTTNRVVTGIGTISNNLGSADMQVLIAYDGSLYVKGTNITNGRFSVTYVTNK